MRLLTGCWMYGWCFSAPPVAFLFQGRLFAAICSGIFWIISLELLSNQAIGYALILWLLCVLVAWSSVKFRRSDKYANKRFRNDGKMLRKALNSSTPIKAYYDDSIGEWIRTSDQHKMLVRIRRMNILEIKSFADELKMEARMNRAMDRTLTGKIACKAVMRRSQALINSGATMTEYVGPRTIGAMILRVVTCIIVIEIFQSLFGVLVSHVKKID